MLTDVARACDAGDGARIVARLREAVSGYAPADEADAPTTAIADRQPASSAPVG